MFGCLHFLLVALYVRNYQLIILVITVIIFLDSAVLYIKTSLLVISSNIPLPTANLHNTGRAVYKNYPLLCHLAPAQNAQPVGSIRAHLEFLIFQCSDGKWHQNCLFWVKTGKRAALASICQQLQIEKSVLGGVGLYVKCSNT